MNRIFGFAVSILKNSKGETIGGKLCVNNHISSYTTEYLQKEREFIVLSNAIISKEGYLRS